MIFLFVLFFFSVWRLWRQLLSCQNMGLKDICRQRLTYSTSCCVERKRVSASKGRSAWRVILYITLILFCMQMIIISSFCALVIRTVCIIFIFIFRNMSEMSQKLPANWRPPQESFWWQRNIMGPLGEDHETWPTLPQNRCCVQDWSVLVCSTSF